MKIGADKYRSVCLACHKPDGLGDPVQQYPPLAGSEWVAGPEASAARQVRIVLYGLQQPITVKGKTFTGQMPAQGGAMRDYEIAAALTFVRNSFGNKADPDDANHIAAPMPGKVSTVAVKKGDAVKAGDRLLSIEAMKMETAVYSPRDAKVADVLVKPGSAISAQDLLVVLE